MDPVLSADAGSLCPGLLFGAVIYGEKHYAARFDPASTKERPILLGGFEPAFSTLNGARTFAIELAVEADRIRIDAKQPTALMRRAADVFGELYREAWRSLYYLSSIRKVKEEAYRRYCADAAAVTIAFLVSKILEVEIVDTWKPKLENALRSGYQIVGISQ